MKNKTEKWVFNTACAIVARQYDLMEKENLIRIEGEKYDSYYEALQIFKR